MNYGYKNSGRGIGSERETRAVSVVEIRNQKRNEMLQKRRTMSISNEVSSYSISEIAEKVNSNDVERIIEGVVEFRRLLSASKSPPVDTIVSSGLSPVFVRLIDINNPLFGQIPQEKTEKILHEAAWVITNIAAGSTNNTMSLVDAGVIPHIIRMITSGSPSLQDQAVWAIGNITGDCEKARDMALKEGLMDKMIVLIRSTIGKIDTDLLFLKNQAWALSNMCRGRNPPPPMDHIRKAIPLILELLQIEETEILGDTYWALSYITDAGATAAEMVIQTGVIEQTIRRLALYQPSAMLDSTSMVKKTESVLSPIIRTVGNITTYDDCHMDYILQLNVLPILKNVYSVSFEGRKSSKIKKEICWVISNIMAGAPAHIDAAIKEGFLEILIHAINHGEQGVKIEATWAICNGSVHIADHPDQIREIAKVGAIQAFSKSFSVIKNDPKLLCTVLDCVKNLLAYGELESIGGSNHIAIEIEDFGLLDYIEELQQTNHMKIASKAESIITRYFSS